MKALNLLVILVFSLLLLSCDDEQNEEPKENEVVIQEPHIGRVIDKISVKDYAYLQLSENKNNYWVAVPTMKIEIGETVYFSRFIEMEKIRIDSLDKMFDKILFVKDARKSPTPEEMKNMDSKNNSTIR